MKRNSLFFTAVIFCSVLLSACSTQQVYSYYTESLRDSAGLIKKQVMVENYSMTYLEGGSGETVVFVHGFGAEKDYWTPMAKYFKEGYHVIIPDLPGFGESDKSADLSYDVEAQADRIHHFLNTIDAGKVFIAGNSMGGNIAGIFAAKYPEQVTGLGLLDTAGIDAPQKSDLFKALEQGKNPLIVNRVEDFDNLIDFGYAEKPFIPSPLKKHLALQAINNKPYNEKVWRDMFAKPAMLEDYLPELAMPVLIIWGDKDRILHVSSVDVLEEKLPHFKTHILKNCGHGPMLERPEETADYILDFLQTEMKI